LEALRQAAEDEMEGMARRLEAAEQQLAGKDAALAEWEQGARPLLLHAVAGRQEAVSVEAVSVEAVSVEAVSVAAVSVAAVCASSAPAHARPSLLHRVRPRWQGETAVAG
jgi:hypothetical protein